MSLEDFFRELEAALGITPELIADFALFGPIILFFATMALYFVSSHQRRVRLAQEKIARGVLSGARKRSTSLSREEIAARLRPSEEEAGSATQKSLMSISELLLKLVNFNKEETKYKLIQSGNRDPKAISRYILQRGMGMIIGPILAWMLAPMIGFSGFIQVGLALVGVLAGGIIVDARLDKAVAARRAKVQNELPVLLDLLTIYLEAGQSFDVALIRTSNALKVSFPAAAAEIFYLRQDLETTIDRERTLREFASRMNIQTARTFVSIVIQSERRGNEIAPALRMLAREARKEVMSEIERKAQKIPTMMQMPMFLFILPSIFSAVISPAAVQIIEKFSNGGLMGGGK